MAATKRKVLEEVTESDVEVEKKKAARIEDRLSDLPEALQLRILACLDAKEAVQTSVLSKTWVSLWTRIPVLEFNYSSFNDTSIFDNFVMKVLRRLDHLAKLDSLKFKGHESCSPEFLKSVFDYAFSHGVKQLETSIHGRQLRENDFWPVSLCDSLTTLKLEIQGIPRRCPFLGPRSTLFKNLTDLYLSDAVITDVEPFSGFPLLDRLTLIRCYLWIEGNEDTILRVYSPRLSDLTISYCIGVNCFELKTPRLRFLTYRGFNIVKHDGPIVLETMEIDFNGFSYYKEEKEHEERLIDDLMSLLCTFANVKTLTVYSPTFLLLSLFPDELVRRGSPFRELKDLRLDFSEYNCPKLFHKPARGSFGCVKGYLLNNSPHAKYTITYPREIEWSLNKPWRFNWLYD